MHSKPIQLLLLCTFALFSDVIFGDPPYNICSSSGSYVNGGSFENNLNNLLSSLSSNASDSKFYNTSNGIASDRVYGLYMCLDYISNDNCQKCIATVTEEIVKLCPQAKEAIVWEELCQLRYSNINFLGSLNVTGNIGLDNVQNLTEPKKFESVVNETLRNLTKVASFHVSANMYATGDVPFGDQTIFALVQCTRDLAANDCNSCLQSAIGDIPSCCYASIGARVLSRSCYLRYEFYAFYNGVTGPTDSSNDKKESKNKSSKTWMIAGIAVVCCLLSKRLSMMNMVKHRPSAVLLFLFIVFMFMSSLNRVSGEDPVDIFCPSESPLYNLNSPFHHNLNLVLGLLSSDTASKAGFYNTFIGEETNRVYGQSLCRGDIGNSTVCKECIEKASQDIMNRCRSESAMIWYNLCQVRYSFQSFDVVAYTGKYPKQNDEEKNVSDPIRFREYLTFLMKSLSNEAAFNPVKNMFAAGEIDYPGKKTIYGLVQCTRDMSHDGCSTCLSYAFTEITACCSYREGGIILSRTCNMRFQMSQFFNASSAYMLVYPTSSGGKRKSWILVLIISGSIFVLALFVGLGIACLRGKKNRDRDEEMSERTLLQELTTPKHVAVTEEGDLISSEELNSILDLWTNVPFMAVPTQPILAETLGHRS
ncbi:Cysteine-rich receptor-like protein [Vigna angularis]|uniref:Cysteine-rich receptor-like protein n=1 Tax=Phaseolus angularis TaxID=3914 RepID=A0A8T0JLC0_PHAAN|nr:Cysteine-rich receptor-like protein [Vigna angularis]